MKQVLFEGYTDEQRKQMLEDNCDAILNEKYKNVKAKITGDYEKTKETHGSISRTEFFQQQFEHNLPKNFSIFLSIFKGGAKEKYEIDIDADIIDGEIMVQLLSPAINSANESARDTLIDAELKRLSALAPDIAIIEL